MIHRAGTRHPQQPVAPHRSHPRCHVVQEKTANFGGTGGAHTFTFEREFLAFQHRPHTHQAGGCAGRQVSDLPAYGADVN